MSARTGPSPTSSESRAHVGGGCARNTSTAASTRLTGAEVRDVSPPALAAIGGQHARAQRRLSPPAPYLAQSRKFGMTWIVVLRCRARSIVSALRLCDTAVTPSDCSIEKATTRACDGSLPTSVMSVPCSVVTVRGARPRPPALQDLIAPDRRPSRAARRSARARCRAAAPRDTRTIVLRQREQILRLAEQRIAAAPRRGRTTGRGRPTASGTAARC